MRAHAGSLAYHPAPSQWMAIRFDAAVPPGKDVLFKSGREHPGASQRTLPRASGRACGSKRNDNLRHDPDFVLRHADRSLLVTPIVRLPARRPRPSHTPASHSAIAARDQRERKTPKPRYRAGGRRFPVADTPEPRQRSAGTGSRRVRSRRTDRRSPGHTSPDHPSPNRRTGAEKRRFRRRIANSSIVAIALRPHPPGEAKARLRTAENHPASEELTEHTSAMPGPQGLPRVPASGHPEQARPIIRLHSLQFAPDHRTMVTDPPTEQRIAGVATRRA